MLGVGEIGSLLGFSSKNRPKVITFAALKGGIGKTTLSVNVAFRAASSGAKVLVVDLDPEACATNTLVDEEWDVSSATTFFDIVKSGEKDISRAIIPSKYPNLDLIASSLINHQAEKFLHKANPRKAVREKLEPLRYQYIFLELPPSFTTLTGSAYLAADLIVIPCTPNIYSLESVALTMRAIDELSDEFDCPQRNYRVLMNQYNAKRVASQEVAQTLAKLYAQQVLPFQIRESAEIANATNAGLTVFEARVSPSLRDDFDRLTQHVCGSGEENLWPA